MTFRITTTDREIAGLAVPALGSLAIDPLLTLADTAFVARLGTTDLAALGVDAAIISFAFFAFNFLAFVTTPLVAKALGRGEVARARGIVGTALLLAVALGIPVTLLVIALAPALVDLMGAQAEVAGPAIDYLRVRALATTAVLVVTAGHGTFRGHKDTRTPLLVAFGVNLLNLALDPLLIFGAGLGLEGAAWGTVVAQWLGAGWFLWLIRSRGMATRPRRLAETLPLLATLGSNGGLLMVRTGFLLFAFTFAASSAARLGAVEIAAHQLVVQLFFLSAMVADSLEIAGQAMVGEESGRGDRQALGALNRRLLGWGLAAGVVLMVAVGLGRVGLRYLASDSVVGDLAVSAAGIAALLEPIGALVFVADGIFVGMLALGSMALSTATGAITAITLMAFTPMGQSLHGIWWALGVFLAVRGLVFVVRYPASAERAVRS
ncbi:MAG: MATE family efflux transporter [Actinobacteria bacterium]|nr:MATE family efflux transporter [Actinomycetota bacterium]